MNLIANLVSFVLCFVFGWFLDKFSLYKMITIINVLVLIFLSLMLAFFEQRNTFFYFYFTALTSLEKVTFIAYVVLLSKNLDEKTRGLILSFSIMFTIVPLCIFYQFGSSWYDNFSKTIPFWISLVLIFVSMVVTLITGLLEK